MIKLYKYHTLKTWHVMKNPDEVDKPRTLCGRAFRRKLLYRPGKQYDFHELGFLIEDGRVREVCSHCVGKLFEEGRIGIYCD